jgi:hypothetical protein
MLVDVVRLFAAIKRLTWKHGVVVPERVKHVVEQDGSHRIELTLQANEVEYEPPKPRATLMNPLGHTMGTKPERG